MYDLERMAHQNEMLVDILLGLEYEKSHRLPDNLPELQRRIRARVRPVAIGKPWPWTKWAIAASFFIAVLGATFYLTKDRLEKIQQISYQADLPNESGRDENTDVRDSVTIEIGDGDRTAKVENIPEQGSEKQRKPRVSSGVVATDGNTTAAAENIIALGVPELRRLDDLEFKTNIDSLHWGNKMEEVVVIGKNSAIDSPMAVLVPPAQQLAYQNIGAKAGTVSGVYDLTNSAHMRAKLNSMNIDPQTSMILNRALDQRDKEGRLDIVEMNDKRIEIKTDKGEYNYLANIKSDDINKQKKSFVGTVEAGRVVLLNDSSSQKHILPQASIPKGGWKLFDDYTGNSLAGLKVKTGHIYCTFRLDADGTPQDIQILGTRDQELINALTVLLQEGPSWQLGVDSAQVKLELKF
jgi:hypothetical protein